MKHDSIILEHKKLDLIELQGILRRIILNADANTRSSDKEEAARLLLVINKALGRKRTK